MNLGDPDWELLDPTPNVHHLFVHFDQLFFNNKLVSRALVRWSKRMYSCAGVCSYEGRNGLCDIALSEPLLKLRPRKDLIETLLHEMIHAFLFITNRDLDRDGHGPNFKFHMHRINKAAGLNITIYHDFHDEVNLYLTHVWRCNGRCQKSKPYFGIVRRPSNRAPGKHDTWWESHQRYCGGTFIKIQEPEKKQKAPKKTEKAKTNSDITKYIINNNGGNIVKKNINKDNIGSKKNIIKDVNKENKIIPPLPSAAFDNIMKTNVNRRNTTNSVVEKVRDVWKNKILPTSPPIKPSLATKPLEHTTETKPQTQNTAKHKPLFTNNGSPKKKMKKIDDYFLNSAHSILKDVYGKDFVITQANDGKKIKAVAIDESNNCNITELVRKIDLVDCPSCNAKVPATDINRHLDECLNKDLIETLSKDSIIPIPPITSNAQANTDKRKLKDIVGNLSKIPKFKHTILNSDIKIENADETNKNSKLIETSTIDQQYPPKLTITSNNEVNHVKIENNSKTPADTELSYRQKQLLLKHKQCTEEIYTLLQYSIGNKDDYGKNIFAGPSTSNNLGQICPTCDKQLDAPFESHIDDCLGFFNNNNTIPIEGASSSETVVIEDDFNAFKVPIKVEPTTSKEDNNINKNEIAQKCPCCGIKVEQPIELHLDECLGFFYNDDTLPQEGSGVETIVIDDDEFDETQILNATGTKSPCPCCLKMVEIAEMSDHLDVCLGLKSS